MKKILVSAVCLTVLSSCGKEEAKPAEGPRLDDCAIEHEQEFGGVYIKETIDDFNSRGFVYGDSVNVSFSNGYTLKDKL